APGSTMRLVEKRRGDSDPAPDRLSLHRSWWLDFDGGGFTVKDHISGTTTRTWRLEMAEPTVLGRAAVGGREQFLTRLGDRSSVGIELREGQLQLEADSRVEGAVSRVPAVGWDHDFQGVNAQLNLPPGWQLYYASGVDDVSSSWVTNWTLLDLFVVLIVAMAVGRLWSWRWGLVALALARRARGRRAGARPARGPPAALGEGLPPGSSRRPRDDRARLRGGSGPGRSLSAARDAAARGGTLHSHRRCGAGSSRDEG